MRKAIIHLKKNDPTMRRIIEAAGPYRVEYREPVFESLVRSIVYQQLSGRVANVIYQRLAKAVRGKVTPKNVLKLTPEQLRACGLSKQKSAYILDLAKHTGAGTVDFKRLPDLSDDAVIEHLTVVKGIGVWTAHMFLIFALRRNDILPTGDLGVRTAIKKAYDLPELPNPAEIEELAQGWRPYCSVAAWYLWRSLDGKAAL